MPISTIHKLDRIVFPNGSSFEEITDQKWMAGIDSMIERPAGHHHPMFRANQNQRPVVQFTTPQLSELLAFCSIEGHEPAGTVNTYLKKASATGSLARAALSHKRINIAKSLLHWTNIKLPHNGRGEADAVLTAVYDGVNDPFVYAGGVALAGNLVADEYFGAGPVKINGVSIPGIQEINIDSGVKLIQEGDASEGFDSFAGIELTEPIVTIRCLEEVNWSTLTFRGVALAGAGLSFYARKYAANGSRVPNATLAHLKFDGILGSALPVDSTGNVTGPVSNNLRCELVATTDAVLPLIVLVNQAIV